MKNAKKFNGNISTWNVKNVAYFEEIFMNAINFNKDLSKWEFQFYPISIDRMFKNTKSYNHDLSNIEINIQFTPQSVFEGTDNLDSSKYFKIKSHQKEKEKKKRKKKYAYNFYYWLDSNNIFNLFIF